MQRTQLNVYMQSITIMDYATRSSQIQTYFFFSIQQPREIEKKLDVLLEHKKFQIRIKNIQLQIERGSSFTNPTFLKEPMMMHNLIEEINSKLQLNLLAENFEQNQDVTKFGEYNLAVINYQPHPDDAKLFNFNIKVEVVNSEIDIDDLLK